MPGEDSDIVVWGDNEKRIKTIQGWFFGTLNEPLLKPGRVLVGEGVLLKQCRKKLKPRQFFLFNDIFLYANIIVAKASYNKPRILFLKDISVSATADEKAIQVFNPQRSFLVYTATPEEAREWVTHINLCIKNLPSGTKDIKASAAAFWIPDNDAPVCMICHSSKFTTFNRRHHCRQCGRVACGSCTKQRWSLPPENKPQRVCNACHSFLSGSDKVSEAPTISTANADAGDQEKDDIDSPTDGSASNLVKSLSIEKTIEKVDAVEIQVPTGPTLAQQDSHDPDDDDDDDDDDAAGALSAPGASTFMTRRGPKSEATPTVEVTISESAAIPPAAAASSDPPKQGQDTLDAMFAFTQNVRQSVFFTDEQNKDLDIPSSQ